MAQRKEPEATVLYADLIGFSRLARELAPSALLSLLNRVFAAAVPPVTRTGGVVDHFAGDALLAHFGAEKRLEDHARRAVTAGLALQTAMVSLRARLGRPLHVCVGVATGPVAVGTLGTGRARRRTVLGLTVNLAALLANLRQPDRVLLTRTTRDLVHRRFAVSQLAPLQHPTLQVEVYEAARTR